MTNYVILHLPYCSSRLSKDHGLIGDTTLLVERATERYLDKLFTADEKVEFPWSRLCCDVGAYLRDGAEADLVPTFVEGRRIRPDPTPHQVAAATVLVRQHVLRLSTQVESANSFVNVLVLDARSFDESTAGDTLPLADICLGYNEPEPTQVVVAVAEFFKTRGLCVALNVPVQGCFLPRSYDGHSSTFGMTIALNRRLYVGADGQLDASGFEPVKTMLRNLYDELVSETRSYRAGVSSFR